MRRGHSIDTLFALVLFGLFAMLVLLVLMSGAGAYRGIEQSMQSHYDQRTALNYVAAKVRHYDAADCVSVEPFGGRNALCLKEEIGGEAYCTWVYLYEEKLMELFAGAESGLGPESGQEILNASDFAVSKEGGLLSISCASPEGETATIHLYLRSEGQVP